MPFSSSCVVLRCTEAPWWTSPCCEVVWVVSLEVLVQVITAKSIHFSCRYIPQTEIAGLKVGVFIISLAIAKSSLVHTPTNQEGAAGSPTPSHTWHTAVCLGVGWEMVSYCLLNRPPFLCVWVSVCPSLWTVSYFFALFWSGYWCFSSWFAVISPHLLSVFAAVFTFPCWNRIGGVILLAAFFPVPVLS